MATRAGRRVIGVAARSAGGARRWVTEPGGQPGARVLAAAKTIMSAFDAGSITAEGAVRWAADIASGRAAVGDVAALQPVAGQREENRARGAQVRGHSNQQVIDKLTTLLLSGPDDSDEDQAADDAYNSLYGQGTGHVAEPSTPRIYDLQRAPNGSYKAMSYAGSRQAGAAPEHRRYGDVPVVAGAPAAEDDDLDPDIALLWPARTSEEAERRRAVAARARTRPGDDRLVEAIWPSAS